jgi:hypothetical protein
MVEGFVRGYDLEG